MIWSTFGWLNFRGFQSGQIWNLTSPYYTNVPPISIIMWSWIFSKVSQKKVLLHKWQYNFWTLISPQPLECTQIFFHQMFHPLVENVCWSPNKISTTGKFVMNFQRWLKNFHFFVFSIAFSNFFKKFQQHELDTYLTFMFCKKSVFLGWTVWGVYWFFKMTPFFRPKFSKNHIFFFGLP